MAKALKKIEEYPDVSFIEGVSFTQVQERMISNYEKQYHKLTGKKAPLAMADPNRLILYACAVELYQAYQYEDRAGKMGLLKYSTGDFLDNLAALKGVVRNEATPAGTTLRFTLSAALSRDAIIPSGVRAKANNLYFATTQAGTISAGRLTVDITARCQTVGMIGNGFLAEEIQTLVDPQPYTLSVKNITATSGGADRETDEELAERVYLAPSSFSTAGPAPSYEYWIKTYSQAINEYRITSESPGEVDIYIMVDSEMPGDEFILGLKEYLDQSDIKPLTDYVVIKKPKTIEYSVEFTYYIHSSDRDMEKTIKAAVEGACSNYIRWQKSIGRDITPSRLIYEVMKAGAQSVEVTQPSYKELAESEVAIAGTPIIIFGGLRDG